MDLIKKYLKKFLSKNFYNKLGILKNNFIEFVNFYNLDHEDTFKKIYSNNIWGKRGTSKYYSGNGSHNIKIVNPYVKVLKNELKKFKKPIIIDAGCGDFNVSKNFLPHSKKFYAFDIFEDLIKYNKKKYCFNNLIFEKKNIITDAIPYCDILIVRQVLQHLSNSDISKFLKNINFKAKNLVITEHYPSLNFSENVDKLKGAGLRFNSGVVLHKKPFKLKYIWKKKILTVSSYPDPGFIVTIFYKLR